MSDTQPEALYLADELDAEFVQGRISNHNGRKAATKLRRLHEQNEMLWKEREEPHKTIDMYVRECNRLEAERDHLQALNQELLEALKGCLQWMESLRSSGDAGNWVWVDDEYTKGVAAIAKAEGENK